EAPPDLVAIADKAMARDAALRYPTAREMAEELRRFTTGGLVGAYHYGPWELAARFFDRQRALVLTVAAALISLAVFGAPRESRPNATGRGRAPWKPTRRATMPRFGWTSCSSRRPEHCSIVTRRAASPGSSGRAPPRSGRPPSRRGRKSAASPSRFSGATRN